jgi:hypothetical protein
VINGPATPDLTPWAVVCTHPTSMKPRGRKRGLSPPHQIILAQDDLPNDAGEVLTPLPRRGRKRRHLSPPRPIVATQYDIATEVVPPPYQGPKGRKALSPPRPIFLPPNCGSNEDIFASVSIADGEDQILTLSPMKRQRSFSCGKARRVDKYPRIKNQNQDDVSEGCGELAGALNESVLTNWAENEPRTPSGVSTGVVFGGNDDTIYLEGMECGGSEAYIPGDEKDEYGDSASYDVATAYKSYLQLVLGGGLGCYRISDTIFVVQGWDNGAGRGTVSRCHYYLRVRRLRITHCRIIGTTWNEVLSVPE